MEKNTVIRIQMIATSDCFKHRQKIGKVILDRSPIHEWYSFSCLLGTCDKNGQGHLSHDVTPSVRT